MDREARKKFAVDLCERAGCSDKISKIHFAQFVDHAWNPHPPTAFIQWWKTHPESNNLAAVRAFNCRLYVDEFQAAPQHVLD